MEHTLEHSQIIRPHLRHIPPYQPIEPYDILSARYGFQEEQIIKLDANENPFGIPAQVAESLANLKYGHIYPDPESRKLRNAVSTYASVPVENILAGSGADELIDLLLRLTIEPGDKIINAPPTFGMYAFDTLINAGQVIDIPRRKDFSLDLDAIRHAVYRDRPKVLFLAQPNNPDGSLVPDSELDQLLELPVLVVLDEAYVEFTGTEPFVNLATRILQVKERDNLIVLRSFSKWAGLAGLRVGFGAFPDWMMPYLWNGKQPYNVNVAASEAACAALANLDAYRSSLQAIQVERVRMSAALAELPFLSPYPSQANFVLCQVTDISASYLKDQLAKKFGILIRYFNKPGLGDHIRISVGKSKHTEQLLTALHTIFHNR